MSDLSAPTQTSEIEQTNPPQGSSQRGRWRWVVYVLLGFAVLFYLLPVYLVVITSLKAPADIQLATTWQLPETWHWQSYAVAWETFAPKLLNSLILAITATAGAALLGSLNGYVLAKWRFPGANIVFPLILFGMFIPYQSVLIPLFQFLRSIGLYGSLAGLILTHIVYGLPITTLIFRNFYAEIPDEMLEAAKMDGAGFFAIYAQIIFPLSVSGFVVVLIWQFTQVWNEFLFAVTLTRQSSQPITVALANLAGGQAVDWNLPMAGSILAALPTLLIYIVLGRYFIRGLLAGSVKG
ncbi:MAG: carbohydrate ABC transporter permease [Trueperaceae bacterium]|nr:carbohydrate ABC transporter permease [Trueperaceae bacterium]